ncbi:hypothetical protein [Arsenicicoccus dermatophilus]|uniref:hypothetical protein n=1 Tax=Arsenicicoccus dermatophilus TaxID=1076331 RepID=UPI001F4C5D7A|nr:hypothetical protein [Arsenicicoccus dermatophilus]MCH8613456.1 hypothetical protein [Arsenicicoccus dermatophilus]
MREPRHARIATHLRGLLAARNVPKMDAAAFLSLTPTTFSRKINGRTPFTIDEVDALIDFLGTSWVEVMDATRTSERPYLPPTIAREVARLEREAREQAGRSGN